MNIVVLLRVSSARVGYDRVIDHRANDVTYVGKPARLGEIREPARTIAADLDLLDPKRVPPELHQVLASCDRLIARSEFDLLRAAELREIYNIPGPLLGDAIPVRDKLVMRRRARERGIDQPQFWSVPQFLAQERAGEFLLKPRRDGSSNGIVTGDQAALRALARNLDDPSAWLVEAFVPGEIYHVDGFVAGGELAVVQLSQYVNTCLSYAHGKPLGSAQVPTARWAVDGTRAVAAALGYHDGSFHAEFIVDAGGNPKFLEIAGRPGGASILEATHLRTGAHLHECDLRSQLGYPIDWEAQTASDEYFGWFVFPYDARAAAERVADMSRFAPYVHSYQKNDAPLPAHGNSYSAENSPLVGVVRGTPSEIHAVLTRIVDARA